MWETENACHKNKNKQLVLVNSQIKNYAFFSINRKTKMFQSKWWNSQTYIIVNANVREILKHAKVPSSVIVNVNLQNEKHILYINKI